jgi:hypothetical protein
VINDPWKRRNYWLCWRFGRGWVSGSFCGKTRADFRHNRLINEQETIYPADVKGNVFKQEYLERG